MSCWVFLFPPHNDASSRRSCRATPDKPDAEARQYPGSRGSPERPADGSTNRQRDTEGEDESEIHLEPDANEAEKQAHATDAATHVMRSGVNADR